jgi:myo-inositol-1(or 4)-monophosphatase
MTNHTAEQPTEADPILAELEREAVAMAREAGQMLMGYFGGPLSVEYKDKRQSDPVTDADHATQAFLKGRIAAAFPDHAVVGEEDAESSEEPLPEFVWVLDPLDGTRNFSQGLPVFACSIGVLRAGVPVVGAIFLPWPGGDGTVLHARAGGGAFRDDEPLGKLDAPVPESRRLTGLPGGFGYRLTFNESMRGRSGETRQIGSIAYELAMTATGVYQYSALTGSLSLWDVAGGSLIVAEAGGRVLVGEGKGSGISWQPLTAFAEDWAASPPSAARLRKWYKPMLFGAPGVIDAVAAGIKPRGSLNMRLRRWLR